MFVNFVYVHRTLKEFYVEAGKEPDSANLLKTPQGKVVNSY
jgi:hypothetical protein